MQSKETNVNIERGILHSPFVFKYTLCTTDVPHLVLSLPIKAFVVLILLHQPIYSLPGRILYKGRLDKLPCPDYVEME